MTRHLATGGLLFAGLLLALAGPAAVTTLTGCGPPPELAHDVAVASGACAWRDNGEPFSEALVDGLGPDECVRIVGTEHTRFGALGMGCGDIEERGAGCVLVRAGEPQPRQWSDRLREGEVLASVLLRGAECTCPR